MECFAEIQDFNMNSLKFPPLKMSCHFLHATMQLNLENILKVKEVKCKGYILYDPIYKKHEK